MNRPFFIERYPICLLQNLRWVVTVPIINPWSLESIQNPKQHCASKSTNKQGIKTQRDRASNKNNGICRSCVFDFRRGYHDWNVVHCQQQTPHQRDRSRCFPSCFRFPRYHHRFHHGLQPCRRWHCSRYHIIYPIFFFFTLFKYINKNYIFNFKIMLNFWLLY